MHAHKATATHFFPALSSGNAPTPELTHWHNSLQNWHFSLLFSGSSLYKHGCLCGIYSAALPARWARLCPHLISLSAALLRVGRFPFTPDPSGSPPCPCMSCPEPGPQPQSQSYLLPPSCHGAGRMVGNAACPSSWLNLFFFLFRGWFLCTGRHREQGSFLSVCITSLHQCKMFPLAGICSPACGKHSRKNKNSKIFQKKLPKSLPPTERVPIWAVRAIHSLSGSSVQYLNCRNPFFLLCVAMKRALLWQRLGSHQTQVWQWSSKQWKHPALPFLHGGSHTTNTEGFINCACSAALIYYKTTAG